jgi:hypothetical protein
MKNIARETIANLGGKITGETEDSITFEVPYQQRGKGDPTRPPVVCHCESVQQMILTAGLHAEGVNVRFTIRLEQVK